MWPDASTTQELLARARQGNESAINALLERHREAIRRLIDARLDYAVRRRVDASDIVQDVLIEASRRLREYLRDPAMPFPLWLRYLARDRLIDAHRRHRLAERRSVDREQALVAPATADHSSIALDAQLRDRGLTPAAAALRDEFGRHFRQALAQLDEPDREMILMRHFEQLTNREVSQNLGLTDAAASMRYLRALRRLRAVLDEGASEPA